MTPKEEFNIIKDLVKNRLNQLSEKFEYQTRIDNNYQLFYITPKS